MPNAEVDGASADLVVLLNDDGTEAGAEDKAAAHEAPGRLHLAFSIFLFDPSGRVLLQQRAAGKALFAGLWSNSCCSHPRPGEGVADAGRRRVQEELGIRCDLEEVGVFEYHAHDAVSGLAERERVHVLAGATDTAPVPDDREVAGFELAPFEAVMVELSDDGSRYTPWLRPAAATVQPWWERRFGPRRPHAEPEELAAGEGERPRSDDGR